MNEMIAFCGIDCLECGALIATREDDDEKRKEVAALWSKEYDADFKPGDINCDGCITESGVHFGYCGTCEIRKCGQERALPNCAACVDYPCNRLNEFFVMVPAAKERLDRFRESLG